jgi:uncharacterized protein (DUF433 family)
MAVSAMAFKIVKSAVRIRLERGETLEDILASYPKLSTDQTDELRDFYTPKESE